jgi:hypothetical protein
VATHAPDACVTFLPKEERKLAFPPPPGLTLSVAVHPGSRNAPRSLLTQLIGIDADARLIWAGAVDESMLEAQAQKTAGARKMLGRSLLRGNALWSVIDPGLLTATNVPSPYRTIYGGRRPWIVIGALDEDAFAAAPLNDIGGGQKWWTPPVAQTELRFRGSKASVVELAHIWSIPTAVPTIGDVSQNGGRAIATAIEKYFA